MIRIDDLDDVAIALPDEVHAVLRSVSDFEAQTHEQFALHRMPGALMCWGTMDDENVSSSTRWIPPEPGKIMVTVDAILRKLHGIELIDMVPGRFLALGVISEAVVARDAFEEIIMREVSADGKTPTVGAWYRVGTIVFANGWQLQINRPLDGDGPRFAYLLTPLHTGFICQLSSDLQRLGNYLGQRHPDGDRRT